MNTARRSQFPEKGAIIIHVAMGLLAVTAFSAFVVDYGVMWVGRRQAQNAADAAARAGAVSLAFDDATDYARAQQAAVNVGKLNVVFGVPPDMNLADVTFPACPANAPGAPDVCVRVDGFRNQARGNPLPMFFGHLVGASTQGVRATATAAVLNGNATDCLKPWAVADKWDEFLAPPEPDYPNHDPDWNVDESFDKYGDRQGRNPEPDMYVPPDGNGPGTGFRVYDDNGNGTRTWRDYGTKLTLKLGDSEQRYSSGWFLALRLADSRGGDDYRENIKKCIGVEYKIGDVIEVSTEQGNKVGPTRQGVEEDADSLVQKDPDAWWNENAPHPSGKGAIADSAYGVSPRIVPVPVFNLDEYLASGPTGLSKVKIRNILGFFIEGMGGPGRKDVVGRLMTYPGFISGSSTLTGPSSFMKTIILVR